MFCWISKPRLLSMTNHQAAGAASLDATEAPSNAKGRSASAKPTPRAASRTRLSRNRLHRATLAVQPSEMRPFSMPTSVFLEMPSAKAVAVCVRPYSARTAFRWSPHNRMASARFKTRLASSLRPKQQWCNFTPLYMRGQIPHRADAVICYTTQRFGRASGEADGRSARLLS